MGDTQEPQPNIICLICILYIFWAVKWTIEHQQILHIPSRIRNVYWYVCCRSSITWDYCSAVVILEHLVSVRELCPKHISVHFGWNEAGLDLLIFDKVSGIITDIWGKILFSSFCIDSHWGVGCWLSGSSSLSMQKYHFRSVLLEVLDDQPWIISFGQRSFNLVWWTNIKISTVLISLTFHPKPEFLRSASSSL